MGYPCASCGEEVGIAKRVFVGPADVFHRQCLACSICGKKGTVETPKCEAPKCPACVLLPKRLPSAAARENSKSFAEKLKKEPEKCSSPPPVYQKTKAISAASSSAAPALGITASSPPGYSTENQQTNNRPAEEKQASTLTKTFTDEVMGLFERYQAAAMQYQIIEKKTRILVEQEILPKRFLFESKYQFLSHRVQIHVLGDWNQQFLISWLARDPTEEFLSDLKKYRSTSTTLMFRSTDQDTKADKTNAAKILRKVGEDGDGATITTIDNEDTVTIESTRVTITRNHSRFVEAKNLDDKVEIVQSEHGEAVVKLTKKGEDVTLTLNKSGESVKMITSKKGGTLKTTTRKSGVVLVEGRLLDDPIWSFVDLILPGKQPVPKHAAFALLGNDKTSKAALSDALAGIDKNSVVAISRKRCSHVDKLAESADIPTPPLSIPPVRLTPETTAELEAMRLTSILFIDSVVPRFKVLLAGEATLVAKFLGALRGASVPVSKVASSKFVNSRVTKFEHEVNGSRTTKDEAAFIKLCAQEKLEGTLLWFGPLTDDWNVEFITCPSPEEEKSADLVVDLLQAVSKSKSPRQAVSYVENCEKPCDLIHPMSSAADFFKDNRNQYQQWVKVTQILVQGEEAESFLELIQPSLRNTELTRFKSSRVAGIIFLGQVNETSQEKKPLLVIDKTDPKLPHGQFHQCCHPIEYALVTEGRKALINFAHGLARFHQRLQVLVLGETNAGKTTFLNSLGDPSHPILQPCARSNTAGMVTLRHIPNLTRRYFTRGRVLRELTTDEFNKLNDIETTTSRPELLVLGNLFTRNEFSYIDFVDTRGGGDKDNFHAASQCARAEGAIVIGNCANAASGEWMSICRTVVNDHGPDGLFMFMNKLGQLEQDSDVEKVKDIMRQRCKELGCPEIPEENYMDFSRKVRNTLQGETVLSDGFLTFLSKRVRKRVEILERELAEKEALVEYWWDQSRSSGVLLQTVYYLMQYCLHGITPVSRSASDYAKDATVQSVISREVAAGAAVAFLGGLAPLIVLPVALPALIVVSYFTRMHTAFSVAAVHRQEVFSPAVCKAVLRCFTSDTTEDIRGAFTSEKDAAQAALTAVSMVGATVLLKAAEIGSQQAASAVATEAAQAVASNVASKVYKQQFTYQMNRALARGMSEAAAKQVALDAAKVSQAKALEKRFAEEMSKRVGERITAQGAVSSSGSTVSTIFSFVGYALPVLFSVVNSSIEAYAILATGWKANLVFAITVTVEPLRGLKALKAGSMKQSEEEWKAALPAKAFAVLRKKGDEPSGTGEYNEFRPETGHFACRGCRNPLYSAAAKFYSRSGWAAFDRCYAGCVKVELLSQGQIALTCSACDGHLGYVYHKERLSATNERHCVKSMSIEYVK